MEVIYNIKVQEGRYTTVNLRGDQVEEYTGNIASDYFSATLQDTIANYVNAACLAYGITCDKVSVKLTEYIEIEDVPENSNYIMLTITLYHGAALAPIYDNTININMDKYYQDIFVGDLRARIHDLVVIYTYKRNTTNK